MSSHSIFLPYPMTAGKATIDNSTTLHSDKLQGVLSQKYDINRTEFR